MAYPAASVPKATETNVITGRTVISAIRYYACSDFKWIAVAINPIHAAIFGAATELTNSLLSRNQFFNNNYIFTIAITYAAAIGVGVGLGAFTLPAAAQLVGTSIITSFATCLLLNPLYFADIAHIAIANMITV